MTGGVSVPKDIIFPSVPNPPAKEYCLHPLDEFQVSFSSWATSETCSLVLTSFLKTSLCQKEGDAGTMADFISDLTISVCFPLLGSESGKLASPSLP